MKIKVLLILTFAILATSYHFSKNFQNREEDLMEAQKVVADLFYTIRHSEFDRATEFLEKSFMKLLQKRN